MRALLSAVAGLAALAFAQTASAEQVNVAPVQVSLAFQSRLDDEIGGREGAYLQRATERALARELVSHGAQIAVGAPVTVEASILDAKPNHPTLRQLDRTPGLDLMRSISTGGAALSATVRGADGQVLAEVSHRYYTYDLRYELGPATWTDAERAIRQFARKVAAAYVANAH